MQWPTRLLVLNLLSTLAVCQFMSQLPLIIKSPYLHTWVSPIEVFTTGSWPCLWNGHIVGWSSWIRVDGKSYQWTGQTLTSRPIMTANQITPTRTIFSFAVAGLVGFNVTYLSPIDPTDMVRQSLPFGYFYVDVWSLDGKPHSVQLYTDITGEILTNDTQSPVTSDTQSQLENVVYHRMQLRDAQPMIEADNIALDSTLVLAVETRPGLTWQIGPADDPVNGLRARFKSGEPLTNSADTNPRTISGSNWIVLAFRVDLGNITQTNNSVIWSLGLIRDPVVEYTTSTTVNRSSYYWSAYSTVDDIVKDVIGKFSDIRIKAVNLDNKILSDGEAISSSYNDLISFALRFVFGSMDITIPRDGSGALNTSDVKIFMKDIGVSSRVSPVETIYAALPALLYVNASIVGLVLEPLLEFQNSSDYKNGYAAPDLGTTYPKVQGNSTNTMELALENCGNMLIMTWAHAIKSGDGSLISRYYNLLKGWADYLEQHTLRPTGYTSADEESNPNMSNLALKGIVGMYAMSKISKAAGNADDASHFQSQAQNYTSQWEHLAITSEHISSVYGDGNSWGLIYILYATRLLEQDSISSQTYDQQSRFYASKMGTASIYDFPYDTNDAGKAKSHWSMFIAATVSDTSLRDFIIRSVWNRAALNDTNPFPTTYSAKDGGPFSGAASPAHGAMLAQLALNVANQDISSASASLTDGRSKTNVNAIVGGVVGGVGGFLIIAGLAAFFWRRRRQHDHPPHWKGKRIHFLASNAVLQGAKPVIVGSSKSERSPTYYPSSRNPSSAADVSLFPPSTTAAASPNRSGSGQDLRSEMEQLREQLWGEVQALHNERIHQSEPPPMYEQGGNDNAGGVGNIAGQISPNVSGPLVPSRRR